MTGLEIVTTRSSMRAMTTVLAAVALLFVACGGGPSLEEIRSHQAAGRHAVVIDPLREMLESDPDSPELHYRYGLALARTGKPTMAIWSLRRAQQHPEWADQAALAMAQASMATQNWPAAIEAATLVLNEDPENTAALMVRAMAYIGEKKEPELAIDDLDVAIVVDPENPLFRPYRVMALILTDRIDEAAEEIVELEGRFEEAEGRVPEMAGTMCAMRAVFEKERGEIDTAREAFEECLERHPLNNTVIAETINFYGEQGEFERGNEILEAIVEEQPTWLVYRTRLAGRLRNQGRYEDAEALLREGLEIEIPGMAPAVWTELASHFAAIDQAGPAAEAYGNAIEAAPGVSEVGWLTYADMLVAADRVDDAAKAAEHLTDERYRKLIAARIALQRGDPAEALANFDVMLPLWPNNAGARYFAARAAEQVGDYDRAIEEYRQSLRSAPGEGDGGLRLAKLLVAMDDSQAAWTAISHHTDNHPGDRAGRMLKLAIALADPGPSLRNELGKLSTTAFWPDAIALNLATIARLKSPARALDQYDTFVESLEKEPNLTHPSGSPVLRVLVSAWIRAGEGEKAEAAVAAALEAHPEAADFQAIAGFERELATGDPAQGEAYYERAIELDPTSYAALDGLARVAEARGDHAAAIEYLDRAARLEPGTFGFQLRAAKLLAEGGAETAAIRDRWWSVFVEFPWESEPLMALARSSLAGGDPAAALDYAERAQRFGGGVAALELQIEAHEVGGESAKAEEVRAQLEALRAPGAAG